MQTKTFTKRDVINSNSGCSLQDFEGNQMVIEFVTAAAVIQKPDSETGEQKDVAVLVTANSEYFTSISATVLDQMDDILELIDEEGSLNIRVVRKKSKGGRDFLQLVVL